MSGDKLSQEQIDALLNAAISGEDLDNLDGNTIAVTNMKYNEYDFHKPEKFAFEHLQSLKTVMSSFVSKSMQFVSSRIRLPIYVEDSVAQQVSFIREYVNAMPKDYYLFCIVDLGLPDLGEIIVELDLAFAIYIHECLSGGMNKRNFNSRRKLSQFELLTLENIFSRFTSGLEESFAGIQNIRPKLVDIETDPNLLKVTSPNDMMALVNVDVKSDHWVTTIRIGVPFFSVESMMSNLENVVEHTFDKKTTFGEEVEGELKKLNKPIQISLGDMSVTLDEIESIEIGDIIPLNTKVTAPLKGYIAGKHKFNCYIGKSASKKAAMFKNFTQN